MNQTDIVNAATQVAQKSKNIVGQQVDRQASALGGTLSQTARDLQQVGSNLRDSGTIGSAAEVADWAAGYVDRAAQYLSNGHTDRFIGDLETFARGRPWTVAASAAVLGFVAARIVKSSSARRFDASSYVPMPSAYDADYGSVGTGAARAGTSPVRPTAAYSPDGA